MQKSTKSALLSAFVFPGIGHLYLRSYTRAIAIIAVTALALCAIIADAMQKAKLVADKIASGEIPLDAAAITAQIDAATHSASSTVANVAGWVILVCWVFGMFDSYRLGKKLQETPPSS